MREKRIATLVAAGLIAAFDAMAWTTGNVPQDGVYKFTFGVDSVDEGFAVPASAVCDVNGSYTDTFSYGFLGTTDTSYIDDVPSNLPTVPHAIDGFKVVKGQKIVLKNATDANGVSCVTGPAASEYLPAGASSFEGRYPVRFAARMPERGYYAVTCTVANASSTANADVTLFSERCHTHAQHLALEPGETKTFSWSVELAPNYFKGSTGGTYYDNAINVVVVGENAALASVTVTKQPTTTENATIRGAAAESINVGTTMWLCDDSTGTDQRCDTPYFNLQNYAGVGSGLSRWAPPALSIRNQGEGGLATSDNAHLNTCLLKPGDYLYVQYGHNEKSTAEFTANLEKYLNIATNSSAKLIIASPVERHNTWDSTTETYGRGLKAYADAGEAWVKAKIDAGVTDVAFVDLNKKFVEWQNEEIVRINDINPAISKKAAIEFYYQSSKGGKVDISHPNNAGADWGAYAFWQAALDVVNAGANAEEGSSEKVQAEVLSGIMDGVAARVAADEPWKISDEIINAGAAPNSYWDATVRAGYDYINSAAVAAVNAMCEDGVVTLSGVTMRVMNQVNYAKAVIDIVSSDKATTNRWYSFYNYDASGNTSGDIVDPEEPGFLSADLDKDVASTSSEEYSETLTVPAGGKAYIWFAEANGNTWQVGENADSPISAKYPLEAWTSVLLDDDCSDTDTWTSLFGGVNTFEVADGAISFSMTGYDSGTTKKNGGFTKQFADPATIADGRFRVSFKARYTQGEIRFALSQVEGSRSYPMGESGGASPKIVATLNGSASVLGAAANVTLSDASTPVAQATVNSDEWMDVDMIVDLDAGKATASIGGGDYATFPIGTLAAGAPYSYFGVTLASEKAHAGAIDDVKIVTLSPSPKYLVEAAANNAKYGSVEINGTEATSLEAVEGSDVALTAVSADETLYKFVRWTNAAGRSVSTKKTLFLESVEAAASYTAVFAAYDYSDDRVATWDFSEYQGDFEVTASDATTITDNGMTISLQSGDKITADGIYWKNAATGAYIKNEDVLSASGDHYIVYTPTASGTLTLKFSVDCMPSKSAYQPLMCIKAASSADECKDSNGNPTVKATVANTEYTLSADLTAGTTYYIWTYSYNWSAGGYQHNYTIPSITYTYAPTWCTVTATAGTGGSATVSASEVVSGSTATFTATPVSGAYRFVNWTDAGGTQISASATYTAPITVDTSLYANFEAIEAGTEYTASVNFEAFGGSGAVSATANTSVNAGPFKVFMQSGDTITSDGIYWGDVTFNNEKNTGSATGRHIEWTAPIDGTLSIVAKVGATPGGKTVHLRVVENDADMAPYTSSQDLGFTVANEEKTLSFAVTAGTLYKIYTFVYGTSRHSTVTIKSITYTDVIAPVTLTLAAGENGSVAINGVSGEDSYTVQKGEYVKLTATPDAYYGLSSWTDGEDAELSTDEEFWCYVGDTMTVTANFSDESSIDITREADFAVFAGDDAITGESAWSQLVGRMEVHGAAGDTLTDSGIYWAGPGTTTADYAVNSTNRYIKFECVKSGTLTLTFKSDGKNGSNYGRIYVVKDTGSGLGSMSKNNSDTNGKNITATAQDTDKTGTFDVEAGVTYYIWPYMYGQSTAKFWVSSITYTAVKSDYSAVTIEGADGTSVTNLYYGSSIALDAPAINGNKIFEGWKVGDETVGTATHLFYTATGEATVTASYRDADAHNFVWASDVDSGDWNDPYNWLYEGVIAASTYPSDASQDVVTVDSAATINLQVAASASNVWFNADATLTGGYGITTTMVAGEGAVTLNNSGFDSLSGKNIVVSNDLWIAGVATNWVNQNNASAYMYGDLKGSGTINLHNSNHTYGGAKLYGNNTEFVGEVIYDGGSNERRYQRWNNGNATSSNAFWRVESGVPTGGVSNNDGNMLDSNGTYYFGGYSGSLWHRRDSNNYTLEIGAINRDSDISIYTYIDAPNITKVGTANLTLGTTRIKNLTIEGGSVTMPVGIAPKTLTIAADTTIYLAGDAAWTAGTVTNLFSYTTLAGTGAGTLADQVEVTGLASGLAAEISIDDKTVKATIIAVPYTDDESATITENGDGSYTVEVTAESVAITVPDGVTVSEVVVSPNTATVTGVPASATVKVEVSWTDAQESVQSAAYAIVKVDSKTGAVSLDEDAVVTVGSEEISLKPVPSDATPLEVSGDGVSVGVKAIPGLVYRLNRGTSSDAVSSTVSSAKATSARLSLVDDTELTELPEGASFYRVSVDVK